MVSFYIRGEYTPSTEVSEVFSALSWLFFWIVSIWCLSLHAVAAGLKSWLGPIAAESGLAQDTVALGGP